MSCRQCKRDVCKCPPGATGPTGVGGNTGATGVGGTPGAKGATGAAGPAAPVSYGYVYHLLLTEVINGTNVPFSNNGELSADIAHVPASTDVRILSAGVFAVSWIVSAEEQSFFELRVNGVAVPGASYDSLAVNNQNVGQVIITAVPNDVLTIRNVGVANTTLAGVVTASLRIHRVG